MTLRRTIVAGAAALLLAGGTFAAWWWLESDASDSLASKRGSAALRGGATASAEPARPVDPRFPPEMSNGGGAGDRIEGADVERVEESGRRVIKARVVDASGNPVANVPVALGVLESEWRNAFVVRSGSDGIARIVDHEAPNVSVDDGAGGIVRFSPGKWTLHFAFPEFEPTAVPIDPRDPPSEPIELVAPALGRLVVKLVDGHGRPVATRGFVAIDVKPAGSERDFPVDQIKLPLTAPDELRIDAMPIGLEVRADAEVAEYGWTGAEGSGPRQAGETATIVVTLGRHGPVVIGELVDAGGNPVGGRVLEGIVHDVPDPRAPAGDTELSTDHRGRFRFDASRYEVHDPDGRRWLDVIARDARRGVTGRARAELPTSFTAGEFDAGRVTLETATLLVSGRVIDRRGADGAAPSPASNVPICVCRPELAANPGLLRGGFRGLLHGRSDDHGEFAIHGFADGEERIVFAGSFISGERSTLPVRFLPGATDVVLEIGGNGGLEGSLKFDPSIGSIHVGVFLRRSGSAEGSFTMGVSPTRDGAFQWKDVPAGRVDVAVGIGRYSAQPNVVIVVPDVEVKPGTVNRDPRLVGLDLRDRIRKGRVELVDPDGEPLRSGTVTLLTSDETHAPILTVLVHDGAAELPLLAPSFDVEAHSDGMAVERRFGLIAPAKIVMRRGFEVVVALDPPFPLKEDGAVSLRLILTKANPAPGLVSPQQRIALGEGASTKIALPEATPMRVDLEASLQVMERLTRLPPDQQQPFMERWDELRRDLDRAFGAPIVDVQENASGQQLLVPLPVAARAILEQMIREFGGG